MDTITIDAFPLTGKQVLLRTCSNKIESVFQKCGTLDERRLNNLYNKFYRVCTDISMDTLRLDPNESFDCKKACAQIIVTYCIGVYLKRRRIPILEEQEYHRLKEKYEWL
jgi:hypothetical protein